MITGASHSLHPNLAGSLTYYRQQLDNETPGQGSKDGEVSQLPAPVEPTAPKSYEVVVELNQIPKSDLIKQAAEERRDTAREAAMLVESMQHKEDLVNTYINVASNSSETNVDNENRISPGEVYLETLDYLRRRDLMAALDKAADGEQLGRTIDITV